MTVGVGERMVNADPETTKPPRTLLEAAIGTTRFVTFYADPVAFVRAFDREPWEFQALYMGRALAKGMQLSEEGRPLRFDRRVVVISTPRQNGKSTLSAWIGLWRFFCDPSNDGDIVTVALDREGAQIILGDARRVIMGSEVLSSLIDSDYGLTRSEIRLRDGRRWLIKSADAVYSRGLRPSTVLFDELGWSADDGALYNVLSAGMAAATNPLTVVTSTVGPIEAGPLWELFQAAENDDPDVLLIYTQDNLSPRITDSYLEGQRRRFNPAWFNREHRNQWGSGSDTFCTLDDWRRAARSPSPRRSHSETPTVAAVDLGWKHDETAIAIGRNGKDGIEVIWIEGFKPPEGGTLDLQIVEDRLRDLVERYNVKELEIESPQGVLLAQRLALPGVRVETIHPTAKSNAERWGALYAALQNGTIRLPGDATLRRQLLSLTIKEGLTGWRVVDVPSIHQDRALAVAMVAHLATRGVYVPLPDLKELEQESRWSPMAAGPIAVEKVRDGKSRFKGLGEAPNWSTRY